MGGAVAVVLRQQGSDGRRKTLAERMDGNSFPARYPELSVNGQVRIVILSCLLMKKGSFHILPQSLSHCVSV